MDASIFWTHSGDPYMVYALGEFHSSLLTGDPAEGLGIRLSLTIRAS